MIELYWFLFLLALGYIFGRLSEAKHYRSILAREKSTRYIPVVTFRHYEMNVPVECALVVGNVVISIDRFKQLLAGLRNFFGGRVKSYETLLDRARREAILRMKEKAIKLGATAVINTRIETASISKGASGYVGSVEVVVYGTAMIPEQKSATQDTELSV